MEKKKSFVITSYEEVEAAIGSGCPFPMMAIPFGAEMTDAECRMFMGAGDVSKKAFETLFDAAMLDSSGIPRVHFIHSPQSGYTNFSPPDLVFALSVGDRAETPAD